MKTIKKSIVLSVFLWAVTALPAFAHGGHEHPFVMGTVAIVDKTHLEINAKDGSKVSFELAPDTEYQMGDKPATLADVKVGQKVVVSYEEHDGQKMAHQVKLAMDMPMGNMPMDKKK